MQKARLRTTWTTLLILMECKMMISKKEDCGVIEPNKRKFLSTNTIEIENSNSFSDIHGFAEKVQ